MWREVLPVRRVLIISLGGAGDTLMATPLLTELREAYPEAAIDVLTMQGATARDILRGNPCVSRLLHHDFMTDSLRKSLGCCLSLRRTEYDVSFTVMPQNRFEYGLITFLIGARRRIGFDFAVKCGSMGNIFLTRQVKEDVEAHLIENNLRLLSEGLGRDLSRRDHRLRLYPDQSNARYADEFIAGHQLCGKRLVGLHPGSGTTKNLALRRWPAEKWAELASTLAREDDTRILLFGSEDERDLRETIFRKSGVTRDFIMNVEPRPILDAAALIGRMHCFICCDTLLTHVAAAMEVPTVVIMGPTPHTSVYPCRVRHWIVRTGIDCSPCYGYSRFGIRCTNPDMLACLKGIQPDMVVEAVETVFKR